MKTTGDVMPAKLCKDSVDDTPMGNVVGRTSVNGVDRHTCVQTDNIKFMGSKTEKNIKTARLIVRRCQGKNCYPAAEMEKKLGSGAMKIGVGIRNNFMDL
jgi:hypothetical protein